LVAFRQALHGPIGVGAGLFTSLDRRKWTSIGSLTSQFFANLYLDHLDHFVKETLRVPGYVRYMDDFLLFGDGKAGLADCRAEVRRFLEGLRLELHPRKQEIYSVRCGIPFLGFRLFPDRRRLKRENARRFLRRMKRKRALVRGGKMTHVEFHQSLVAWIGDARHGDTWMLRKALFQQLVM